MRGCASIFRDLGSRRTTPMWNRSTERYDWSVWMRTGSPRSRKRSRSSKLGGGNTTRVVLTGLTERGRHTKSLVNSRLAANSQAQQLPETHSRNDAEKGDRSWASDNLTRGRGKWGAGQDEIAAGVREFMG